MCGEGTRGKVTVSRVQRGQEDGGLKFRPGVGRRALEVIESRIAARRIINTAISKN